METVSLARRITRILDVFHGKDYEEKIERLTQETLSSKLRECNEEILKFETKYGMAFEDFKNAWDEDKIPDKRSHEVETDYIEWEAVSMEKNRWLSALRDIRRK
jgi:hypothetical protein